MLKSIDQLIDIIINNGQTLLIIQLLLTLLFQKLTLYYILLCSVLSSLIYKLSLGYNLPLEWEKLGTKDICLITGGSNGLGLEIIKQLVQKKVTIYNLDIEPLTIPNVNHINCNIGNEKELSYELNKLIKSLNSRKKFVSIVINNAGIRDNRSLINLPPTKIRDIFNINTFSQIWILQKILANHIEKNPLGKLSIVNVSSILGTFAPRNLSAYCGSKGASIQIHESLVQEFKEYEKIRFLLVTTGQLNTSMFKDVIPSRLWFAPVVDSKYLSQLIVDKINSGYKGVICEPFYSNFLPGLRCFPLWFQDFCRYISEIDNKVI